MDQTAAFTGLCLLCMVLMGLEKNQILLEISYAASPMI